MLILNPPYNVRIAQEKNHNFYNNIGRQLKHEWSGCNAWVLSGDLKGLKHIGLRPSRKIKMFNGPIETRLLYFPLYKGSKKLKILIKLNKKEIKFIIINKIKKIEMEVEDLKLLTQPIEPENSIGRISRMDAINNKSINDRMLRKAQEKLHNLKLNLKSINNNDFGLCINCKKNY